jgi:hypothetical protein
MRKLSVVLAICVWSTVASAQVKTLGPVSFVVPDGMSYQENPSGGSAVITRGDGKNSAAIAVAMPVPSVGDADANFKSVWGRITGGANPTTAYNIKSRGGYGGRQGSDVCKDGVYCILFTLETPKGVVPVFVVTPNMYPDWGPFTTIEQSVRVAPAMAQPPKKNINIADLVGTWGWGAASSITYVNPSTGQYVGSSTTAAKATYVIRGDGTYTVTSSGLLNNRPFKDQYSGTIEFTPELIVFRSQKYGPTRYRFITYVTAVDGATILTLVRDGNGTSQADIDLYAENFVRPPG